jgi:hypothetical protein
MRLSYLAERPSEMSVTLGDREYDVEVRPGAHAVYLLADGEYDDITVTGTGDAVCIDAVALGLPRAAATS